MRLTSVKPSRRVPGTAITKMSNSAVVRRSSLGLRRSCNRFTHARMRIRACRAKRDGAQLTRIQSRPGPLRAQVVRRAPCAKVRLETAQPHCKAMVPRRSTCELRSVRSGDVRLSMPRVARLMHSAPASTPHPARMRRVVMPLAEQQRHAGQLPEQHAGPAHDRRAWVPCQEKPSTCAASTVPPSFKPGCCIGTNLNRTVIRPVHRFEDERIGQPRRVRQQQPQRQVHFQHAERMKGSSVAISGPTVCRRATRTCRCPVPAGGPSPSAASIAVIPQRGRRARSPG